MCRCHWLDGAEPLFPKETQIRALHIARNVLAAIVQKVYLYMTQKQESVCFCHNPVVFKECLVCYTVLGRDV